MPVLSYTKLKFLIYNDYAIIVLLDIINCKM